MRCQFNIKLIRVLVIAFISLALSAEVNAQGPELITTYNFGPNAFPVPEMLDANIKGSVRAELGYRYALGFAKDVSHTPTFDIILPLFTSRANLRVWYYLQDFYTWTPERINQLNVEGDLPMKGREDGDIYISTDIQILRQNHLWYKPEIALRATLKTASGGGFDKRRHYDSPAYFFDVFLAKSIHFKHDFFRQLRLVGTTGFLCWQTGDGSQNDAVMYGVMLQLEMKYLNFRAEWAGYSGWIENAHDKPQSLMIKVSGDIKGFSPFFKYEHGLRDFPYDVFSVGLAYSYPLFK